MLFGSKPDLSKARGFGAKVFVKSKPVSKLDEKALVARWIGLSEETTGGHLVYWSDRKRVSVERNVRFVDGTEFVGEEATVVTTTVPPSDVEKSQENEGEKAGNDSPGPKPSSANPSTPTAPNIAQNGLNPSYSTTLEASTPAKDPLEDLEAIDDLKPATRPQRERKPSAYVRRLIAQGNAIPRGIQLSNASTKPSETTRPSTEDPSSKSKSEEAGSGALAHGYAMYTTTDEATTAVVPQTREKALDSPQKYAWIEAEMDELTKLRECDVYTLVPRSDAKSTPIPLRWVYDIKRDGNGDATEYKARIVVRGDKQVEGVNYTETFSSVLKSTAKNILFAIAAKENWHIRQSDFKSAYLNAKLDEEIYTEQPPGHEIPGKEDYVWKLDKALYGSKQAGREWFLTISSFLVSIGFTQCDTDHAVFYRHRNGQYHFIGLHVDDNLHFASRLEDVLEVEEIINKKFPLKIMGEAKHFLGTTIERDRTAGTISLGQTNYIDGLVSLCNLETAKPATTPLPLGAKLGNESCPAEWEVSEAREMQKVPYREAVGGLMYIANGTRPDIAYAANLLARVASNPGRIHWQAVKHLVRYLKGTRNHRLTYGAGAKGLVGYSDASHGTHDFDYKSVSGYAFILNGGAISWSAKKQSIVALSTAEAEYIAMTHATKELLWIRNFLSEVFRPIQCPIQLFADNQSAIAMAKNDAYHSRTKHISIRYHFIRHHVTHNHLRLTWVNTHDNYADLFTKPLDRMKTSAFAQSLGLAPA
jgi:hypothetical protein